MINSTRPTALWENLEQLRTDSLAVMARFALVIGFGWILYVVYPATGTLESGWPWVGSLLILACAAASLIISDSHALVARHLFIWGTFVSIACAVFAYHPAEKTALLILPIIFASVLLGRRFVFTLAAAASVLVLLEEHNTGVAFSLSSLLPIGIVVLVTLTSWLSVSNLYTTLTWFHDAYEISSENERIARDRQGELRRVLKALDEATFSLDRANYTLTLERNRADDARRLKQQFAQTISHELRTPLNLIVGFTEMMTQSPSYYGQALSPAYMRDLTIVHRNALHLQTLVNDVLDLARIEAAQMAILPEQIDPVDLVKDAIETARSLVETRGLELRTAIDAGLPAIWVDPTRIRQVLFNLLNNAARFTEQGSITVRIRQRDNQVVFSVEDTGVGIAATDIPHIFEEFHQVDGTTKRKQGGIGLGLTISRQFVELHGGRIWVESEVEKGSKFSFSLPAAGSDQLDRTGKKALPLSLGPLTDTWDAKRLLLAVTHSPSAATLLTRYVRGYHTIVVADLEQARTTARDILPQGIVLDTALEDLDVAHLEELAHSWGLPQIPFIACPLPGEEVMRKHLLVNGYIIKPISRQGLWEVLRPFGEHIDRLLVIDDDPDFVRLVNRMLDNPQRRYQFINAYSGKEGLVMLRMHKPDLILLDLELPDFEPVELTQRIRSEPCARDVPIIVISGRDAVGSVEVVNGPVTVSKANGVPPGQIIRWVESILETTMQVETSTTQREIHTAGSVSVS
ncbi:MAG TPA: ATP-binding protein [Aggregatilineales bacterium]|nr:ATP-binding protein [Aggregatilineales bacterium]